MSSLFRSPTQAVQPPAPVAAFNVQTSALGKPIPIVYGTMRLPGNVLWYGDFHSTQSATQAGGGGGKGGLFGGGNSAASASTTYNYFVSVEIGLCEGPIVGFGQVFVDKAVYANPTVNFNFTTFTGTYPQTPWTYLQTNHQTIAEDHVIPASPGPYVVTVLYTQSPFTDFGVVSIGGTVFAKVAASPAVNQYTVSANGVYTFNSANAGTQVTISYQSFNQQPPNEALGYNGIAYVAANLSLGTSASLQNFNFEVRGIYSTSVGSLPDADPSLMISDLLTNVHYGCGFPSALIGSLTTYQNYALAAGLLLSVSYSDQRTCASMIDDIMLATNSAAVWNGTSLTVIPWGDQSLTGNGKTYTPPSSPAFALTDDDFMPNQGSSGSGSGDDPVLCQRKRPADKLNSVKIEFLNRSTNYNPEIVEAKDQALIDAYGMRQAPSASGHLFADPTAARTSAQLNLQRQLVSNVYTFTVDARYAAIDPMDIISITDSVLGLSAQWVRVTEITENDDDTFTMVAEEYLQGTGGTPTYSFQQSAGFSGDTSVDPGDVAQPVVFEPTDELGQTLGLGGGLIIACGVCGQDMTVWGGCDVWASYVVDGEYQKVGTIVGASRIGTLSATLASVTANPVGQTIDTTSTASVDLSESEGALLSGAQGDMTSLNTRCFVGPAMGSAQGEIIAYQTATLQNTEFNYNLTTMVRGAYGTETNIAAWPSGTSFLRLDNGCIAFLYDQSRVGAVLYLKFASFNLYGQSTQSLSDVLPFGYTIQGYALSSPLPDVQNFRSSYVANVTNLTWDEVEDFRPVLYEIRKGDSWDAAQILGRVAHPPFATFGDGSYWIAAYSQPVSALIVYSETPVELIISGSVITENIIELWDEQATGWTGTFFGGAGSTGPIGFPGFDARTGGAGDWFAITDFLAEPDILNYGGTQDGGYTIPTSHEIDVGYVSSNQVMITWAAQGIPHVDDFLSITDILNDADVLGASHTQFIDVWAEIALSQDGATYGAWTKFAPGVYTARKYKAQIQMTTIDPETEVIVTAFTFGINVFARIDHYTNQAIDPAGTVITFQPDGAATPAAFNGGPDGAIIPALQITILNAQTADQAVVSSLSLSSVTVQVTNGGVGVARNVNLLVEGF